MKVPASLKQGNKIGIMAPARKISEKELEVAIKIIKSRGFEVELGNSIDSSENQFAGIDEIRTADLQRMLDNPQINAIFFARGGYGSVRIIDKINFSSFVKNPKWLVGYSDMTVFHCHSNKNFGIETLHASMPINFANNSSESLESLFKILSGLNSDISISNYNLNRKGKAKGELIGGNLSVLYSLLGSKSFPDFNNKILFLEDLDEYLYHIDRMMMALKRAGVFDNLAGLLVGGMTKMNDNEIPFGKTAEEIIRDVVDEYDFPIAFGLPVGHMDDNRALVMGRDYKLEVVDKVSILSMDA